MGAKACGIIGAVNNFRLLIQVTAIDDREYRHRRNTPEGREAAFSGEKNVAGSEVNDRVVGVSDNAAGRAFKPKQSQ